MSHVCWAQQPWGTGPTRFCPTLPGDCETCGGLVCAEHGCQRCGRTRDATPTEQARADNDARVLGSGAGYIGRHRV